MMAPELAVNKPLAPGWSDPRNWVPVPSDFQGSPADCLEGTSLNGGFEGWTWERVNKLYDLVRRDHGGRAPQTDLERWVRRLACRLARRMARRIVRRELGDLAAAVADLERRLSRGGARP
jgi:hypothetical protein